MSKDLHTIKGLRAECLRLAIENIGLLSQVMQLQRELKNVKSQGAVSLAREQMQSIARRRASRQAKEQQRH